MYPKISVITPSYNQGKFIEECIKSVVEQGYPNLEYIVIDGGSTDNSVEIIKKYESKISYWVSEKDNGQSNAINKGFGMATGDIIAWLNSDDLYYGNSLWKIAEIYERCNEDNIGFIVGNGYRYGWPEERLARFCPKNVAFTRKALVEGLDYILQPSVFVYRKAALKVGFLNESLHYCMDWDWWLRLSEKHRVIATDDMLSLSREYEDTKTSTGGMHRWLEIQTLTSDASGLDITAGSLFFLTETLRNLEKDYFDNTKLAGLWENAHSGLNQLCGQYDGFPYESDEDTLTYVPTVCLKDSTKEIKENYPKISIITPSYNQDKYLERTILSVINQNYSNLEYIVIDGKSTDKSVEIIKKYEKQITFWKSEQDNGPAEAINKGFQMATGSIIGWLNSDDVLTEGALFRIADEFLKGEKVVYGHALYVNEHDVPVAMDHGYQKTKIYLGYQQEYAKTLRYWETVYMIPQPTVYWSREILQEMGMLNTNYKFIFDYDYFTRITKMGVSFKLIDCVQALYRIHDESKTSSFNAFYEELYDVAKKNLVWDNHMRRSFLNYYAVRVNSNIAKNTIIFRLLKGVLKKAALMQLFMKIGNPEKSLNRIISRGNK